MDRVELTPEEIIETEKIKGLITVEEAEKNAISHRQKALVKAKQFLARQ